MELKFSGLKVDAFKDFLAKSDISYKQMLEFQGEDALFKAHPPNKIYINYQSIALTDLFDSVATESKNIRLPLVSLKHLIKIFGLYKTSKIEKVDGVIDCKEIVGADNEVYYKGVSIKFSHKQFNAKVIASDYDITPYMEKKMWENFTSSKPIWTFTLTPEQISQIVELSSIYGEKDKTPVVNIVLNSESSFIRSRDDSKKKDLWSIPIIDPIADGMKQIDSFVSMAFFDFVDKKIAHTCRVFSKDGKEFIIVECSERSKYLIPLLKA